MRIAVLTYKGATFCRQDIYAREYGIIETSGIKLILILFPAYPRPRSQTVA